MLGINGVSFSKVIKKLVIELEQIKITNTKISH
jgi:hypothetical protein